MECANQCPFIDRIDHRCSSNFSLERLNHAFDHCFDNYKACPLFQEMMAERRLRRVMTAAGDPHGQPEPMEVPTLWVAARTSRAAHATSRFVQLTVARTTYFPPRHFGVADAYAESAA